MKTCSLLVGLGKCQKKVSFVPGNYYFHVLITQRLSFLAFDKEK